jgi:hypothetical protein
MPASSASAGPRRWGPESKHSNELPAGKALPLVAGPGPLWLVRGHDSDSHNKSHNSPGNVPVQKCHPRVVAGHQVKRSGRGEGELLAAELHLAGEAGGGVDLDRLGRR